ncbi:MAG: phosphatase [Lachnospiraceae bacterium]
MLHYELDAHTHSIASGHAYSSITEMAEAAHQKGLKLLGITEHTKGMPGTCHPIYFANVDVIPRMYKDMKLLIGAETNIIDFDGKVDQDPDMLMHVDYNIASMHGPCLKSGTREQNTQAYIGAMKNPYIQIIGHPDDERFPVDFEALVIAAKKHHVLLELNNNSINPNGFRMNTFENASTMLRYCKQYEVPIIMDSDAHIACDIGRYDFSIDVIRSVDFPEELIVNTSVDRFLSYLKKLPYWEKEDPRCF